MILLRPLLPEDLAGFYPLLQEHFPPSELKKLPHFLSLCREGVYEMWRCCSEDGSLRGLAFLLRARGARYILLDYLVMLEKNGGWGTQTLAALRDKYPQGILLETEALTPGLPEEVLALRRRRHGFYRRNGWVAIPYPNLVFGEVYLMHLWARELPEDLEGTVKREQYLTYKTQLPDRARYEANVWIEGYTFDSLEGSL